MSFRKDAGKPICQSKEAELERKRKTLMVLPVILEAVSGVEYVLGTSVHKPTAITCLQGLKPSFSSKTDFDELLLSRESWIFTPQKYLTQGCSTFLKSFTNSGLFLNHENLVVQYCFRAFRLIKYSG